MKLIVQIPCLNEEATLPITLGDIPRSMDGVDSVELLVIDDGSTDRTSEVARELGVQHVVRFSGRRGLAAAFAAGLDACLRLGADIIVSTDGDNQYAGADIPQLIAPILAGRADLVVGDRQTDTISEFSPAKKRLQKLGSWAVRRASATEIPDAASGFRAYSRDAALRLNIISSYSYTLETIIQAGREHLALAHVPVHVNPKLRESRLFRSTASYVGHSAETIVRTYAMYRALRVFMAASITLMVTGLVLSLRYVHFMVLGEGRGHVQSTIIASTCFVAGFLLALIGLLADLTAVNRRLSEEILLRVKRLEADAVTGPAAEAASVAEPDR